MHVGASPLVSYSSWWMLLMGSNHLRCMGSGFELVGEFHRIWPQVWGNHPYSLHQDHPCLVLQDLIFFCNPILVKLAWHCCICTPNDLEYASKFCMYMKDMNDKWSTNMIAAVYFCLVKLPLTWATNLLVEDSNQSTEMHFPGASSCYCFCCNLILQNLFSWPSHICSFL